MNDIFSNMGVVGLALVIAFFFIDKLLPLLRGRNGNGVSQVAARQTEILQGIQEAQTKQNEALQRLVWIAEEESKYYRTRNGK